MENQEQNAGSVQPLPHPSLALLNPIVGKWDTQWTSVGDATVLRGTDTYEWQTNEFFLIHHVASDMPFGPYRVLEVIGNFDQETNSYAVTSFDSQGHTLTQKLQIDQNGVWRFFDDQIRATLSIHTDGKSMTAVWEQKDDKDNWIPWLDMKFTRIA